MAPRDIADPHFGSLVHLGDVPRQTTALLTLKKLASVVTPIMRKRSWKVGELAEFNPTQRNLMGLNVNYGQKIFVRLRHGHDPTQFLPYETVVDTLLHELTHNTYGPHDAHFYRMWNELREEYYALKRQGYTGDGFMSTGRRVGGKAVPLTEVRRQARLAAERRNAAKKRNALSAGSGQKLGGAAVPRSSDMRSVLADAAERRNTITEGCGSGNHAVEQKAEEEARRLGFRTKGAMEDADRIAIAIAQMEGDRDANRQEMQALGASGDGLSWSPEEGLEMKEAQNSNGPSAASTRPAPTPTNPTASSSSSVSGPRPGRPMSRLVAENPASTRSKNRPEVIDLTADPPQRENTSRNPTWTCKTCTLINDNQHLCCDACGVERPESPSEKIHTKETVSPAPTRPLGWQCRRCGSFMEAQWWTCSACGLMKESS